MESSHVEGAAARRVRAVQMLALCTAFWGLSFPVMKALSFAQQKSVPGLETWFITGLSVFVRFLGAALVLVPFIARSRPIFTMKEIQQGLLIGGIGGAGILLQMDGLSYTSASTSAFLTQFSCVLLPIWSAIRLRRPPGGRIWFCCALVLAGVGILADVDLKTFRIGRGELETLLASCIFTSQILWLEHPGFASNRTLPFSAVMFVTMALTGLPLAISTTPVGVGWIQIYSSPGAMPAMLMLIFLSTLGGYLLMNHWQKHVPATHAGLIYCLEPAFASLFALFLPGLFSSLAGVPYENEKPGWQLFAGGSLVTLANVALQWRPSKEPSNKTEN